ncbi:hypothetical protein ABIF65_002531 [Bradyrhizobium japonicum]|uniref:Uncharacterized protein n=1 Tax=Bradyrhizobium barranii subsp. barranii TaxID=2823807 RepID=A0A939M9S2_9BRAD|nr:MULTISPECIES: hypothetical protein [Bradyrhizobium]MBR0883500.1 hypothetical protein [Bradyrhizobium liaoningense]MBR1003716.1 hypothetical protein [Bradyrhizobium liaoningense]MBR1067367.1 hypothetical protein [Bradyrhizobium liaoningense]MCP1742309.1 hypothetical protein [Bradyrhizobium japonicum]MCP1780672.1 hypothetical protein [Bradyrhizobium japonicum]
MSWTRAARVRRIRDTLECGMDRAVEIERGTFLLDYLDRAKALGSNDGLTDVLREVVLDQYAIRGIDLGKING